MEVDIETQARFLLDDRHAHFLGRAGVDGRFEHGHRATRDRAANGAAGRDQRREVGPLGVVDRRRHGDDEDVAGGEIGRVRAEAQLRCRLQLLLRHLERVVAMRAQFRDARLVDVEAEGGQLPPETDRERQADVAEADDRDARVFGTGQGGGVHSRLQVGEQQSSKSAKYPECRSTGAPGRVDAYPVRTPCRSPPMHRLILALVLAAASAVAPAATRTDSIVMQGNPVGTQTVTAEADGARVEYSYNDRGRGDHVLARWTLDASGIPVSYEGRGNDYMKAPVEETFSLARGKANWRNRTEQGERTLDAPAFYVPAHAP